MNQIDKLAINLHNRIDKLAGNIKDERKKGTPPEWKGKSVIPLNVWFEIAQGPNKDRNDPANIDKSMKYYPDDFDGLIWRMNIHGQRDSKEQKWYQDFLELMEFIKNPKTASIKCGRCILEPGTGEEPIFNGVAKVIAKTLLNEVDEPIYPCNIVNWYQCPYRYDNSSLNSTKNNGISHNSNVDAEIELGKKQTERLFKLHDLAFRIETGLTMAEKRGEIKNVQDVYNTLTNLERLDEILSYKVAIDDYQESEEDSVKIRRDALEVFKYVKDKICIDDLRFY